MTYFVTGSTNFICSLFMPDNDTILTHVNVLTTIKYNFFSLELNLLGRFHWMFRWCLSVPLFTANSFLINSAVLQTASTIYKKFKKCALLEMCLKNQSLRRWNVEWRKKAPILFPAIYWSNCGFYWQNNNVINTFKLKLINLQLFVWSRAHDDKKEK